MRKLIIFLLSFGMSSGILFSQAPQAFKYQAAIRNSNGTHITNQAVSLKVSILEGSESGSLGYSETHLSVTNEFGLASFLIGIGSVVTGSFSSIDWATVDGSLCKEIIESRI